MKPLRDFDLDMLIKGANGEFSPSGAERQSCHKLELRGLMSSRQAIVAKPFRGRAVNCCVWLYRTTDAGRAILIQPPDTSPARAV
jgi:hypothetical protein